MRRALLIAALLAVALPATAAAAEGVNVTFDPSTTGEPSVLRVDARLPVQNWRGFALQLTRGLKIDPFAVANYCQASDSAETDSCRPDSRIGGGTAKLTLSPGGDVPAQIGLYLAPKQRARDLAGVVAIATVAGRKHHAVGRIFRLDRSKYPRVGLEILFDNLRRAFRQPSGIRFRVDRLKLHVGTHRTVDGERHDLLTNPSRCGTGGWPWHALVIFPMGDRNHYHGAVECSPVPTP